MTEATDAMVSAYFENLCRADLKSSYIFGNEKSKRILQNLRFMPKAVTAQVDSLAQNQKEDLQKMVLTLAGWQ